MIARNRKKEGKRKRAGRKKENTIRVNVFTSNLRPTYLPKKAVRDLAYRQRCKEKKMGGSHFRAVKRSTINKQPNRNEQQQILLLDSLVLLVLYSSLLQFLSTKQHDFQRCCRWIGESRFNVVHRCLARLGGNRHG